MVVEAILFGCGYAAQGIDQIPRPSVRLRLLMGGLQMTISRTVILFVIAASLAIPICTWGSNPVSLESHTIVLKDGWRLQSSAVCAAEGETISMAGFGCKGWLPTDVPSTVLAALVKNGLYKDPYFGKNMEGISSEPFQKSWWYRREFDVQNFQQSTRARLIFEGINYRADIFLNGERIGSADRIFGAFLIFNFDVTRIIKAKRNILAVEVLPPQPGDFTIGFVDWNPTPPDRNMGLFREVKLRLSGPVSIDNVFVQSKLTLPSLKEASLTITADLINQGESAVSGTVEGTIGSIKFAQPYSLDPRETKEIHLTSDQIPELSIKNPRLWWPNNLGNPDLYTLSIAARAGKLLSDHESVTFGIRDVKDYINEQGYRGYQINGRKVLIRGGGWVDDLMLKENEKNLEAQFIYVRHMNLNTVRLEGIWGSSQKLYDLADRYGILLMVGWSCQWEWKDYLGKDVDDDYGGVRSPEDIELVTHYFRNQVTWLRNHPSIFVWVLGSDLLPRPELEKKYLADLARIDPTRPTLSSCKDHESAVTGRTAVKMNGPYDYVTPNYWYLDTENGGAFGFNTETGPGPQPPPIDSMKRMLPPDHLWPIDNFWNYHCGRNEFNTLDIYKKAFDARYGEGHDLSDFTRRTQAASYEALRAMFEAFGARKPVTTGVIQWMLNAAWPKLYWQCYDYYLMPGGAYFATRKGCQPITLVYDYGDHSIVAVNDTYQPLKDFKADIQIFSLDSHQLFLQSIPVQLGEYESKQILKIPPLKDLSPVYFVDLKMKDAAGKIVADNFYWLSTKEDVLDEEHTDWFYTPNKSYADLTSLQNLKEAMLKVEHHVLSTGKEEKINIVLKNSSPHIAFFVELKIVGSQTGEPILPILWSDNDVSILPGETRTISATVTKDHLRGQKPVLHYSGWNVTGK